MNKNNRNNEELNGLFIYNDPKRGCVYYDIINKNGYVLSKSDYQSFNNFSLWKILSILSIYLFVQFLNVELWIAALMGIGIFVAIEIIFRKKFLYELPKIENYKRVSKDRLYVSMAKNMGMARLIFTTIIALITATLIIIFAELQGFDGLNKIITYIMALVMFAMFVNGIMAIAYKTKNKDE